jgi:hypothetical protein
LALKLHALSLVTMPLKKKRIEKIAIARGGVKWKVGG